MKNKNDKRKFYALMFFLMVAILVINCNFILTSRTIDSVMAAEVKKPNEVSMKEWVLNEVRKNGIDEYKVWALINCESKWQADASLINYSGRQGVDRGLWQISDKYHPEVSNSCAYDYSCSTKEAIRIIKKHGFKEWVCNKKLGL